MPIIATQHLEGYTYVYYTLNGGEVLIGEI